MNKHHVIRQWGALAAMTVSVLLLLFSILAGQGHVDTESAAKELGNKVEARMNILDGFVSRAASQGIDQWMHLPDLPEDMVIYRYVADTLQCWAHQFPLRSDDLRTRAMVQRLGDSRGFEVSPLTQAGEELSYKNFGPKWYLVKRVPCKGFTLIVGLEVVNELGNSPLNGINPRFRLNPRYSIMPISGSIGSPVVVYGQPQFMISADTVSEPDRHNPYLFWLAIAIFILGSLQFLSSRPGWLRFAAVVAIQAASLTGLYFYGMHLGGVSQLFSPLLYADGGFRYSLGAVVLVNLLICAVVMSVYLCRWSFLRLFRRHGKVTEYVAAALLPASIVGIAVFLHHGFRSIAFNSSICLELFKLDLLDNYTAIVYVSFLMLSLTIPLLMEMMSVTVRDIFGRRYHVFSRRGRFIVAALIAAYFTIMSSVLGFKKETGRVDVWANKLAMDRDITLEIQLRVAEDAIQQDPVVGALSELENSNELLRARIANTHLIRVS